MSAKTPSPGRRGRASTGHTSAPDVADAGRRATLKDVARESGVSVSTASRCLSGRGSDYRISQTTIARVLEASSRLRFRPNNAARSLRTRRSGLIGVVLPDVSNPFFAALASAIGPVVEDGRMGTLLGDSGFDLDRERRLIEELCGREIEGLVLCSVATDDAHLSELSACGTPVVLADRAIPGSPFCCVVSDHKQGGRLAAQALVDAGHRTIAFLQGAPESQPNQLRLQGYREVLEEHGIAFQPDLVSGENFSIGSGYRSAADILDRRPDVTAFFAANNPIVIGAMRQLAERGLRTPADISLVAFDDHPLAGFLAAPLTVVAQDTRRLGQEAAELLRQRIAGNSPGGVQRVVPVSLVTRASIAAPRDGVIS